MKCERSVQSVRESRYRWRVSCAEKVRLSLRKKTGVGRGVDDARERELTSRRWCGAGWTRGRRVVALDAVMMLGDLRCDAPWSRGWRADGGNERDGVVDDRQACVSDGCGARRMQRGRWWEWWRWWLSTNGSDGTVGRPEVRSIVNVMTAIWQSGSCQKA